MFDLSKVLTPDTMKVGGVLISLWLAKVVVGKTWAMVKSITTKASVAGVALSALFMGGASGVGYGIGEVQEVVRREVIVAHASSFNDELVQLRLERRLADYAKMDSADYDEKWKKPGQDHAEFANVPQNATAHKNRGPTSIAVGISAMIVAIAYCFKNFLDPCWPLVK